MKKYTFLFSVTLILFTAVSLISCRFLDDAVITPVMPNCDKTAVEDAVKFNQISTDNYTVTNVVLNGDCLEITIGASGCDPNNWGMNLIGVPSLANIYPPLFQTRVELINNEVCQAVFQKTVSFDITPFQIAGQNSVQINIEGWNTNIVYQY